MVTIKLNLTLINIIGKKELSLVIKEPKLFINILETIELPKEEVGILIKNNKWAPIDCIIEDNDELQIFPFLYGG